MSYYTTYNLFAHPVFDAKVADIILERLREYDITDYAVEDNYSFVEDGIAFDSFGDCPWSDPEEDMLSISKEFPDIHFELHGEGEMNDDIWTQHFVNGKSQLCRAEIIIPPFDPEKLE